MEDTITGIYCERLGPRLLAEPFNAVSNGAFLIAAWAAWSLARGTGGLSAGLRVLIALAASVGIGSGLWHTLATPWAMILDVVPIALFLIWMLWLYAVALVFRVTDPGVCSVFPIGTHSLWHSFTGLTVYLAMRSLILHRAVQVSSHPVGRSASSGGLPENHAA